VAGRVGEPFEPYAALGAVKSDHGTPGRFLRAGRVGHRFGTPRGYWGVPGISAQRQACESRLMIRHRFGRKRARDRYNWSDRPRRARVAQTRRRPGRSSAGSGRHAHFGRRADARQNRLREVYSTRTGQFPEAGLARGSCHTRARLAGPARWPRAEPDRRTGPCFGTVVYAAPRQRRNSSRPRD